MKTLNCDFFEIYIPQNFYVYEMRTYPMVSTHAINVCMCVGGVHVCMYNSCRAHNNGQTSDISRIFTLISGQLLT